MIKLSRITLPLVALTLMAACTSNQRIQSNYTDNLDFSPYKTFDFTSPTETSQADLAGELQLYFSAAVMQQLHAKGLQRSDDPDILITVLIDVEDRSRPPLRGSTICPQYEDYYSRTFFYEDKLSWEGRRPMCIYTEGTIAVDLTDVAQDKSIMEADTRVRLDKEDRGDNLLLSVSYDVATMFGESPSRDGRPPTSMAKN